PARGEDADLRGLLPGRERAGRRRHGTLQRHGPRPRDLGGVREGERRHDRGTRVERRRPLPARAATGIEAGYFMKRLIYCSRLAALMSCCTLVACATDDAPAYQTSMRTPPVASTPQLVTLYVPMPVPAADDEITPLDYYAWAQAA